MIPAACYATLEKGGIYCRTIGGKCRVILRIKPDNSVVYAIPGVLSFRPLTTSVAEFNDWANYRLDPRNNKCTLVLDRPA